MCKCLRVFQGIFQGVLVNYCKYCNYCANGVLSFIVAFSFGSNDQIRGRELGNCSKFRRTIFVYFILIDCFN